MNSEKVKSSRLFLRWKSQFELSGCRILKTKVHGAVEKNDNNYRYIFMECEYLCPEHYSQTRSILLRGPAVVVIPIVFINGKVNLIVVKQRRIIDGRYSIEFPSGGVEDHESEIDSLKIAASRELHEETGISVAAEKLILLQKNVSVCASAFDETATWFATVLSLKELSTLKKKSGNHSDGEYIVTELMPASNLSKERTSHILTGFGLLREMKYKSKYLFRSI